MSLDVNEAAPILQAATDPGGSRAVSPNAIRPILLAGGLVVNAAYCIFLLIRHTNPADFRKSALVNGGLVAMMAILWSGNNFVCGIGAYATGLPGLVPG